MKHIFIFTVVSIMLVGCGSNDTPRDRVMEPSQEYSVSSGDKVIKTSEDAQIKVIHKDGENKSTVVLMEGNATIIHN
ncbi:MAG: hypothetical protein DSZ09_03880 [Sulfurovum sp.]|nr:MAG: hypothetical protein DSZ09_03880 [Sulfurovum sp.]RUM71121.1 MAG: hypothetical protein DSZ08_03535 [Sulfurovum sp.]RUM74189.1 MAG: hypothetical protein DSZ12_05930 [Sulfurovum sp.]